MKKTIIIALATVFTTGAFAATSGSLLLKGVVPRALSISVTAETVAAALPLDQTQSNTKVAVVNEKSNANTGYKVTISSANQGKLVHGSVSSSTITYNLRYNNNGVGLSGGGQTFTYPAGSYNVNRNVDISYTGVPHENLVEGTYQDTVTFTIAAN